MIHRWKYAVAAGILCAAIELTLLLVAEPGVSPWLLLQSALAWFACGIAVMLSESGLPPVLHSVLMTLTINSGWFIAESFAKGKPAHFLPMIIASAVLGLFIGLVRKRALGRSSLLTKSMNLLLVTSLAGIVSCGRQDNKAHNGHVIEIAKFRKKTGVDETEFKRAVTAIDRFAEQQAGLISRDTGPDEKGGWIDIVRWRDMASARAAAKAAETSEICAKAFSLLDPKFEEMNHITVAHSYERK